MQISSCYLFYRLKKRLIGELLLTGKFISKDVLDKALEEQRINNKLIGELLVELGALSKEELNIVLKFQENLSTPKEAIKFAGGIRKKLGELLLEVAKISENDLEEVLSVQKISGRKIGEILLEKGLITEKELKAVLLFQKIQEEKHAPEKIKLGELLLSLNVITQKQLESALKIQRNNPEKKLGEILIESGYAKKDDIERGLKLQQKLATIALSTIINFSTDFLINELPARELQPPATKKAQIQITAEVKSYAKINLTKQVNEFIIKENHINKGFIDLEDATYLMISTNNKSLFLVFEGFSKDIIEEVEIFGLGEPVKIGPHGGMILIKDIPKRSQFNLSYRIRISKNARVGTYAWPYTISVTPF